MSRYVSEEIRELVASRANYLCEYCLIHEDDTYSGCQVDHIVSLKHGGATEPVNLAYACAFCNQRKGSDLGSLSNAGMLVRFFNPRTDRWADHFRLEGVIIRPLTDIGEVTVRILGLNDSDCAAVRELLRRAGYYPPASAFALIGET